MICIAGKNEIAIHAVKEVLNHCAKNELIIVPNKTDSGSDSWQPSLKKYAIENDISIYEIKELYNIDDLIFISLEYDKIVKCDNFKSKQLYNIHFSKLPAYKGVYTSFWPIFNSEKKSGVTLHLIDSGIDTGDIIDQIEFFIPNNFTCRDLYFEYLNQSQILFTRNLKKILEGNIISTPQPILGASYYSKLSIDFNKINIDFYKTAHQVSSQIRAFIFEEYQLPVVFGYEICGCSILSERSFGKPGVVLKQNSEYVTVSTVDYQIKLVIKK